MVSGNEIMQGAPAPQNENVVVQTPVDIHQNQVEQTSCAPKRVIRTEQFFKQLAAKYPKRRRVHEDAEGELAENSSRIKPPHRSDFSRRRHIKDCILRTSMLDGNEYVVFGVAKNSREYSLDSYHTNKQPSHNSPYCVSIAEKFIETAEGKAAMEKWKELVTEAQRLREQDPAWKAGKPKGRWENKSRSRATSSSQEEVQGLEEDCEDCPTKPGSNAEFEKSIKAKSSSQEEVQGLELDDGEVFPTNPDANVQPVTPINPTNNPANHQGVSNDVIDVPSGFNAEFEKSKANSSSQEEVQGPKDEGSPINPGSNAEFEAFQTVPPRSNAADDSVHKNPVHRMHSVITASEAATFMPEESKNPTQKLMPKTTVVLPQKPISWKIVLINVSSGKEYVKEFTAFDPKRIGKTVQLQEDGREEHESYLVKSISRVGAKTAQWDLS